MTRILTHVKRQAVGYLALFVALGGTGYAAVNLPRNSVGSKQLRNGSVGPSKLGNQVVGYVRDYARIDSNGAVISGRPTPTVSVWSNVSPFYGGDINWSQSIPASCVTLATTAGAPPASYASAATTSRGKAATTGVSLSGPDLQVSVAIVCPR